MMTDLLEHIDARGVATLTLNRPERHNAFDDRLIAALAAALERLGRRTEVRVVVLRGAGRSFSAGADIGWMRRMATLSEAENRADARALADMLHGLHALRKPTLALVQGNAYGGGVGLVAACDIAVASRRAGFSLSEVKFGLIPATISPFVVAAIGSRHARRYVMTAEVIPAARACEIGLVHEIAEEAELDAAGERVIAALLQGAPDAQVKAKDLVSLCAGRPIDAALAAETSAGIAAQRASAEAREGLDAFLSKRPPAWRPPGAA